MNRRQFISATAMAVGSSAMLPELISAAERSSSRVQWPIGCFNRPWAEKRTWGYEVALQGIKDAGYKVTGLLSRSATEPLIGSDATPDYLEGLKRRIAAAGLKVNMGALRIKNELPLDEQIKDVRKQIDNGKVVGVEFLLTFGVEIGRAHV